VRGEANAKPEEKTAENGGRKSAGRVAAERVAAAAQDQLPERILVCRNRPKDERLAFGSGTNRGSNPASGVSAFSLRARFSSFDVSH
jgi:hypothetical protein